MRKTRTRRSFRARWALPLVAGPGITLATMAALYHAADETGRGDGPRIAYSILNEPAETRGSIDPATASSAPTAGAQPGSSTALRSALPPRPPPDPETFFPRVIVIDGASFRAVRDKKPVIVRIAGVSVPAFRDSCTDPAGIPWKCGPRVRAELARLIGGRTVACSRLDDSDPEAIVGRCRVGSYDIARWLVEQGWADPADAADPELTAAADRAKAAGKGRFGPAPFGVIAG